jgi:hypothetical protein
VCFAGVWPGTEDQRLLVLSMTRRGETSPMIVFDHHGRALFANQVRAARPVL